MPKRSTKEQLKPRLTPPVSLSDPEATLFRSLVGAVDPDHFCAVDRPLLVEYVRACVQADRAAEAIARDGAIREDGRPCGWVTVQEKSVRALVALAARLRLCPQSRFDRLKAGSHSRDQVFGRDDDDPDGLLARPDDGASPLAKWRGKPVEPTGLAKFR